MFNALGNSWFTGKTISVVSCSFYTHWSTAPDLSDLGMFSACVWHDSDGWW